MDTENWGTADIEMHPELFDKIKNHHQIRVLRSSESGDGFLICRIASVLMKPGYHGVCNIIVNGESLYFRRDQDT